MREFDLGEVIAERSLIFQANAGWSRDVRVRIGRPLSDSSDEHGPWLCPYQVAGLNRDRVMAIFGVDAMQALLLAIHTIPAELAAFMREPGGRFLFADALETGFIRSCRTIVDLVDEVFSEDDDAELSRVRSPAERFFLNVDLDIETAIEPLALVQALEPHAYALERPPGRASFELNSPVSPRSPEPLICEFVRLVRLLPSDAREIWDRASRRVFDVGIQSLRQPFSESHSLSVETLRQVVEVGAEIAFTVYSLAQEDGKAG